MTVDKVNYRRQYKDLYSPKTEPTLKMKTVYHIQFNIKIREGFALPYFNLFIPVYIRMASLKNAAVPGCSLS